MTPAIRFGFSLSGSINLLPCSIKDAVPSLRYRPPEVTGLEAVVGRFPDSAVCRAFLLPVTGRFVPGLEYPVIGRPVFETGRIICEIPPAFWPLAKGFSNEVPGLGAFETAFSSTIGLISSKSTH